MGRFRSGFRVIVWRQRAREVTVMMFLRRRRSLIDSFLDIRYTAHATGPMMDLELMGDRSMASPSKDVTQLLLDWSDGDQQALDQLLPLVYDELHRLAEHYMRRERPDHTLQPTALVHEAYLRLIDQQRVRWRNRAHFFAIAAQAMRRILVDHARRHQARRGVPASEYRLMKPGLYRLSRKWIWSRWMKP